MMLGGDLWFESFAVPWLAEGPLPEVLSSDPSLLFALGALSSYWLFAIGWVAFGVASLRARVFPVWISVFIVVGGIAGYQALLAPWGIPLGPSHRNTGCVVAAEAAILSYHGEPRRAARYSSYVRRARLA